VKREERVHLFFLITGMVCSLFLLGFAVTSFFENENRAGTVALIFTAAYGGGWFLTGFIFPAATLHIATIFCVLLFTVFGLLAWPFRQPAPLEINVSKTERYDERHVIFGRMELEPGMPQYEKYYSELNPRMKGFDDHLRTMPKLGELGGEYAHELDSPYFDALFEFIAKYNHLADPGSPSPKRIDLTADKATRRVKGFAGHLGALNVRITRLKDYHVYTHAGRRLHNWGDKNNVRHTHAIVFSSEMDHEMVHSTPQAPAATESAVQYMHLANVGIALAMYLSKLGYSARAHIDGNYQLLATAAAHDAGIGELGRLGLIITPTHGPRVRLSVVTTDLELIEDQPINFGVQHFCKICKKCADNCPSQSIEFGEKKNVRGVVKWQSQMETCYKFWRKAGTDCAICMAVCPYSKPHTFYHNIVRFLCTRNPVSRHIALFMDDLLYSRIPRHTEKPDWFANE
jgi:ferredoxin